MGPIVLLVLTIALILAGRIALIALNRPRSSRPGGSPKPTVIPDTDPRPNASPAETRP